MTEEELAQKIKARFVQELATRKELWPELLDNLRARTPDELGEFAEMSIFGQESQLLSDLGDLLVEYWLDMLKKEIASE